jgi:hypothetical protein
MSEQKSKPADDSNHGLLSQLKYSTYTTGWALYVAQVLNHHPVLNFLLFHLEQQSNAAVEHANHTFVRLRWISKVEPALEVP